MSDTALVFRGMTAACRLLTEISDAPTTPGTPSTRFVIGRKVNQQSEVLFELFRLSRVAIEQINGRPKWTPTISDRRAARFRLLRCRVSQDLTRLAKQFAANQPAANL